MLWKQLTLAANGDPLCHGDLAIQNPIPPFLLQVHTQMKVSLNYCSQNGGNLYRDPYYNGNPNIGPRIDSNLGQSPNVNQAALEHSKL